MKKNDRSKASKAGVLLLDSQLRPVHYNMEAAHILDYPEKKGELPPLEGLLPFTLAELAESRAALPAGAAFRSGRRRYRCRTFLLDVNGAAKNGAPARVVVMLEREDVHLPDLERISNEFQLTTRERETVQLLMKGLTSKEIADAMSISPNTVKSFLKLVMAKVGASNRTGIIAKIFERAS
jgi:DNA-binding CsgD family transcriptional regulator